MEKRLSKKSLPTLEKKSDTGVRKTLIADQQPSRITGGKLTTPIKKLGHSDTLQWKSSHGAPAYGKTNPLTKSDSQKLRTLEGSPTLAKNSRSGHLERQSLKAPLTKSDSQTLGTPAGSPSWAKNSRSGHLERQSLKVPLTMSDSQTLGTLAGSPSLAKNSRSGHLEPQSLKASGGTPKVSQQSTIIDRKKQKLAIERMVQENKALTERLDLRSKKSTGATLAGQRKDAENQRKINQEINEMEASICELLLNIESEEVKLNYQTSKLDKTRMGTLCQGGITAPDVQERELDKKIEVLECRLGHENERFNISMVENAKLKEELELLRIEKTNYQRISQKAYEQLTKKEKEMIKSLRQASLANENRYQAQAQIISLQKQSVKEQAEFQEEFSQLDQLLQYDSQRRASALRKEQEIQRKYRLNDTVKRCKSAIRLRETKKAKPRRRASQDEKSPLAVLRWYEHLFSDIQVATGFSCIEKVIERYSQLEDENFRLYRLLIELQQDQCFKEVPPAKSDELCPKLSEDSVKLSDAARMKDLHLTQECLMTDLSRVAADLHGFTHMFQGLRDRMEGFLRRCPLFPDDLVKDFVDKELCGNPFMNFFNMIFDKFPSLLVFPPDQTPLKKCSSNLRVGPSSMTFKLPTTIERLEVSDSDDEVRPFNREELNKKADHLHCKRRESKLRRSRLSLTMK